MPDREPDDELLAAALGRANDCPPLEDLERLLEEGAPAALKQHVDGCAHCRTELELLRSFTSNEVAEHEKRAADAIAARLKARSSTIPARRTDPVESRPAWWKRIFEVRWLSPAAATLAVVLLGVGLTIELRRGRQPSLDTSTGSAEVLRSSAIAILSPVGDLREKPAEIRWEAAPNAARYRVRIMEVDRTELWSTDTRSRRIDLPPEVRNLILPWKTLLIQVAAFDASGQKIAESETARFRLLQKVYTP
jgi:hypothetical protein